MGQLVLDDGLKLLSRRRRGSRVIGKPLPFGDRDRCRGGGQGVADGGLAFAGAEQEPDGRGVNLRVSYQPIHHRDVGAERAQVRWLEIAGLQLARSESGGGKAAAKLDGAAPSRPRRAL